MKVYKHNCFRFSIDPYIYLPEHVISKNWIQKYIEIVEFDFQTVIGVVDPFLIEKLTDL